MTKNSMESVLKMSCSIKMMEEKFWCTSIGARFRFQIWTLQAILIRVIFYYANEFFSCKSTKPMCLGNCINHGVFSIAFQFMEKRLCLIWSTNWNIWKMEIDNTIVLGFWPYIFCYISNICRFALHYHIEQTHLLSLENFHLTDNKVHMWNWKCGTD